MPIVLLDLFHNTTLYLTHLIIKQDPDNGAKLGCCTVEQKYNHLDSLKRFKSKIRPIALRVLRNRYLPLYNSISKHQTLTLSRLKSTKTTTAFGISG